MRCNDNDSAHRFLCERLHTYHWNYFECRPPLFCTVQITASPGPRHRPPEANESATRKQHCHSGLSKLMPRRKSSNLSGQTLLIAGRRKKEARTQREGYSTSVYFFKWPLYFSNPSGRSASSIFVCHVCLNAMYTLVAWKAPAKLCLKWENRIVWWCCTRLGEGGKLRAAAHTKQWDQASRYSLGQPSARRQQKKKKGQLGGK